MVLVRGDSCLGLSERLFVNGILNIVVTATYNVAVRFCWLGKAKQCRDDRPLEYSINRLCDEIVVVYGSRAPQKPIDTLALRARVSILGFCGALDPVDPSISSYNLYVV